jgi:hypothetical protein
MIFDQNSKTMMKSSTSYFDVYFSSNNNQAGKAFSSLLQNMTVVWLLKNEYDAIVSIK